MLFKKSFWFNEERRRWYFWNTGFFERDDGNQRVTYCVICLARSCVMPSRLRKVWPEKIAQLWKKKRSVCPVKVGILKNKRMCIPKSAIKVVTTIENRDHSQQLQTETKLQAMYDASSHRYDGEEAKRKNLGQHCRRALEQLADNTKRLRLLKNC